MKDRTRRAVACVVGLVSRGGQARHVYDHGEGRHFIFSGSITDSSINVYDHGEGCHITGTGKAQWSLYHHCNARHINLRVEGGRLSGYDHDTSSHFSGSINAGAIVIYDHETGSHHHYSA